MSNLTIFEVDLSSEDLSLALLIADGSLKVIKFGLGIIFDLFHGGGVVTEGLVSFCFHGDDLLAQHAH